MYFLPPSSMIFQLPLISFCFFVHVPDARVSGGSEVSSADAELSESENASSGCSSAMNRFFMDFGFGLFAGIEWNGDVLHSPVGAEGVCLEMLL